MTDSPSAVSPPILHVAIIGGGPAGLMAAETIASAAAGRVAVTIYERMPSLGRKFLLAGRGGLNLTHSETAQEFMGRYGSAAVRLRPAVEAFPPEALRAWAEGLGQETFVGTSGRVFPRSLKASPLLRAWLRRLDGLGVRVSLRRRWIGWDAAGRLLFDGPSGSESVAADATVLALGGASWPRLGSDGSWVEALAGRGVPVAPLRPANMGFAVAWSDVFRDRFAGEPVKAAAFTFGRRRIRGEAVISRLGLEGGAIYALSTALRDSLERGEPTTLWLDLKPDLRDTELAARIGAAKPGQSLSNVLRKAAGLSPAAAGLVREAHGAAPPREPLALARAIKGAPLRLAGAEGLERAISTAGGIALDALDSDLMLAQAPGVFACGEMLDWEAPTGGYLLQACFATGAAAGRGVLRRLGVRG